MLSIPICHTILIPSKLDSNDFSIFQGFSYELIQSDYQKIFNLLKKLPYDLVDIFLEPEELVSRRRQCSSSHIHLINEGLVNQNYLPMDQLFQILWCSSETLSSAKTVVSNFKHKPIIISTCQDNEAIFIDELDEGSFAELLLEQIDFFLSNEIESKAIKLLQSLKEKGLVKRNKGKLELTELNQNAIFPNLNILQVYGYKVDNSKVTVPTDITESIIATTKLIDNINSERNGRSAGKNDAIVYTASIYAHLYNANFSLWREITRKFDNNFQRNLFRKVLIRNDSYSRVTNTEVSGISAKEMQKAYENKYLQSLISMRQRELSFFTETISIKSATQFIPAIRLPNSVNLHHDKLKTIAYLISKDDLKSRRKLNQRLREYSDIINSEIDPELSKITFNEREGLLTICDFPIEWISVNRIFPLMFSHEISRTPVIPGNLFLQSTLCSQEVFIPYSSLKKILIVRSFRKDDPIKDHLYQAIELSNQEGDSLSNIDLNYVDVNSEEELCRALNSFDGAIVIFDCHGGHGGIDEPGWLLIGSERIDIWKLKGKTQVPLICLLSACSTHPIDGSHASVANGLFSLGAHSILGTYAPIRSTDAAAFFMRILYRISAFIPLIIEKTPISWRTIITGMFRMSYVTDIMRDFRKEGLIETESYLDICQKANIYINSFSNDWFEMFISDVLKHTDMSKDDLYKILARDYQFVETMLYSHLGQPEDLIIIKDNQN